MSPSTPNLPANSKDVTKTILDDNTITTTTPLPPPPLPPIRRSLYSAAKLIWFLTKEELPWKGLGVGFITVLFAIALRQVTTTTLTIDNDNEQLLLLLLISSPLFFNALIQCTVIGILFIGGLTSMMIVITAIQHRLNRLEAHSASTTKDFTKRVQSGRVIRTDEYELFLPPASKRQSRGNQNDKVSNNNKNNNNNNNKQVALLFYPGLLVDHLAYANILGRLSDEAGILVVLVNAECWGRVVIAGATSEHAIKVMDNVASSTTTIDEWLIGGHSLGAMVCTELIRCPILQRRIRRMVLWGTHLALDNHHDEEREVLIVNAEHDHLMRDLNPNIDKFLARFASKNKKETQTTTHHVIIEGGNHDGFGNYGPQSYPTKDGKRTTSRELQQERILEATTKFVLKKKKE